MDKQGNVKPKKGKCQRLWKCCREIRMQSPNKIGQTYSGFNTLTDELEYWICIKINPDINKNVLQRVFNP